MSHRAIAVRSRKKSLKKTEEEETKSYPSESFPDALISALRELATDTPVSSSNSSNGSSSRASKRRRLEPADFVPVLEEKFIISRPTGVCSPIVGQITCNDVGRYLKFCLDKRGLIIRSKANAPCDAFQCVLCLPQSFSDATQAALAVLEHSREDNTQEGALTVLTTISLDETDAMHHMHFTLNVHFNTATSTLRNIKQRGLSQHILNLLGTNGPNQPLASDNIAANTFYKVAFMPSDDTFNDLSAVPITGLETTLYPFQRRALHWLLMREQVKYSSTDPDGRMQLTEHPQLPTSVLPFSFHTLNDVNHQRFYVSDLYHVVTRDITPFREIENSLRGGILAEEMGLGKTVEIISLILAHKRGQHPQTEVDAYTDQVVQPTGATLIVTPDTLHDQWLSEFRNHAPSLLVMKYSGMKFCVNDKRQKAVQPEDLVGRFVSKLASCDVVITTYSVLQTEIHYATAPPERSMRYKKQHERYTSPLIKIGWWRICLDEAQQIDSGVSSAARVARVIPRVNAWAVTGTPVKDDTNDLWGLLLFLRYEPFASYQVVWKALLKTHQTLFSVLFNRIAIRQSKRAVRNELKLPSQKRYIFNMTFTAIEEHHYLSQFRAHIARAGLNEQGIPLHENWDPNSPLVVDFMKRALTSLRQTILHPELGSDITKAVVYKTLAEHLETMIDHSEASIRSHQRSYLITKLNRGQLLEGSPRVKEALKIWEEVLEEVEPIILETREELRKALENARQEQSKNISSPGREEPLDEEILETAKVGECRRKLRSFLDLQHRVTFFIASAFFQIKSDENFTQPDSDEFRQLEQREVEGYELAQSIRREILQEPLTKVSKLMGKLQERANTQSFVEIPEILTSNLHGIESGQIAADLEMLSASLNQQANVIDEWREHVIQLLLKPVVDSEDEKEITGEEYEDSTKVQDNLMVYTLALGAIIGDRHEALTGWINERIRYETTTAEGLAREGGGHAPEMLLELLAVRRRVKPLPAGHSLRQSIIVLRELSTKLRHDASTGSSRARSELQIVTTHLKATQDILTNQSKVAASLQRDLDSFTSAMNSRVEFYRQLQSVSDNVAPLDPEITENLDTSWNRYLIQEANVRKQSDHCHSNRRHLLHMREESSIHDPCAICCGDDFTLGAVTTCGHTFCKSCIVRWVKAKYRCPLCKKYQTPAMLSEFNRTLTRIKRRPLVPGSQSLQKGQGVYSNIPDEKRRAIQSIKLRGPSYSTKVDTLIKHLIWLREEDPGAKSIIFTQFQSFFGFLEQALSRHDISFAAFNRVNKKSSGIQKFKDDPSIECLLMDAKAHSSGLNLVNASHVFICEPLLNTALELQAIARVDRIGQEHETTVWLYVVEGTVEENIHALSERRRLAHMGDGGKGKSKEITDEGAQAAALEAANSRELEDSSLTKLMGAWEEGEIVDKGDLWECLFGRAVPA
ncbi:SNF2 family N-terminal domain-containing protein [Hypoxylon argillaceum]|nr:SNF2 family N-terminal domain-containing protein [Hypoxylon argillaceum]